MCGVLEGVCEGGGGGVSMRFTVNRHAFKVKSRGPALGDYVHSVEASSAREAAKKRGGAAAAEAAAASAATVNKSGASQTHRRRAHGAPSLKDKC